MTNNRYITILLLAGILLLVNVMSNQFFLRFDLTENDQYTLSEATLDILRNLEDPVTITAYFSDDLPPTYSNVRREFQDLLIEYANRSRGYVNYEFISPESDEEIQTALQNGIQRLLINVSEKDQVKQQQAFMGALVVAGEQQEVIPFVSPDLPMEYTLSSNIKKVSVTDKPSIGMLQGHGEPPLSQLGPVYQGLSVLYDVQNVDLSTEDAIPDRYRAVAIVSPTDTIPEDQLAKLDDYLSRGGKLFIAINRVDGNLQARRGSEVTTGLESWLAAKGLQVQPVFIVDQQCSSITVQQQQGMFTIASEVRFPYLPLVTNFVEHPVTQGLERVVFPFASPIQFNGDSTLRYTPIVRSSARSGTQPANTFFRIAEEEWTAADFSQSHLTIGAVLEGPIAGNANAAIILFGDGDFPLFSQSEDNVSLMVNSIDWLSDDTGLIALRTKGIAARPIDQQYLGEEGESQRNFLKYLNFGLPILLVLAFGGIHYQRQRSRRLQRMQERWG
jgi:gliding-associated putative ABC transporter substrate-binding component GldG